MYATIADMRRLLPNNVSIGDRNIGTPSPGRTTGRSVITTTDAKQYIAYAQQYIDSRLRNMYLCPLIRAKSYETEILSNIHHGTNVVVTVRDTGSFEELSYIRLQNKSNMETTTVKTVNDLTTITLTSVAGIYLVADNSKIAILEFPDPIPLIAARLAVSFAFDQLYVQTQSPDVSTYGKTQRNLARSELEDVLKGTILLNGQNYNGRHFVRGTLFDAYRSPAEITKGEDKEST